MAKDVDNEADLEEVGGEEKEPVAFWESKQRELVTSVVDYNLESLGALVNRGTINLSPRYQRRNRWEPPRQSKLIESFLMNVPVPPIFLNEDTYGSYSVIDGKQRLTSIHRFLTDELTLEGLEVFHDINGMRFSDLPDRLQAVINTRPTLRAVIILRQSDLDIKFEVFQRLNTGGLSLNPQEIRNSTWPGAMNDLILDLSEDPLFHSLLGIVDRAKSKIHQTMRDAELVLRYLTFRNDWQFFKGGVKRSMDHFMAENQRLSKESLAESREAFQSSLRKVQIVFGDAAFKRWQPEKGSWRQQLVVAIFDAQMFALQAFEAETLERRRDDVRETFKSLFADDAFRKSIDAATNTPSLFRDRVRIFRDAVRELLRS